MKARSIAAITEPHCSVDLDDRHELVRNPVINGSSVYAEMRGYLILDRWLIDVRVRNSALLPIGWSRVLCSHL